ncbi:MAG: hypothetical protein LUD29_05630 [Clostridia bacterium]|nr:hypothetical protein [Clostridia bacterium]
MSFEYTLFLYDLIPESVYCYTSASYRGGRTKYVKNAFGNFLFRDVPDAAYPWGYSLKEEGVYSYLLAGPEKALCDKLYVMPPVRTYIDLEDALFESLRIEEGDFMALSKSELVNVNIKKGQGSTWNF